jgi:hypothetical protein
MYLMSVVCCQVEVSASRCSLVQRFATECVVSECDREAPIMGRPWPNWGCGPGGGGQLVLSYYMYYKV